MVSVQIRNKLAFVSNNFFLISDAVKMDKFTTAEFREIMDKRNNIRNMSVIGHLRHGMC